MGDPIRISLCTTCHNRANQLKAVFEHNLSRLLQADDAEWIILNYNSTDDLDSFMVERLPKCAGRVCYVRELSGRSWHASISKNIAHRIALGDVLMNLDCDNRIGDCLEVLREEIQGPIGGLHNWSGRPGDGTFGRIAVRKSHFYAAGGYDESFYPMAGQDMDLLDRLRSQQIIIKVRQCDAGLAIPNTKTESIANCRISDMTWWDFHRANMAKSLANRNVKRLVANEGQPWGTGKLEFVS